ncbi:tRNA1Val (adenine37-N6)-methyltransferase [Oscillibacter sp. PC13]|uniref:tRNA1(Val) (adenine(37)-N6)-methyltransferase n=1 Tax=Oscillibacter sp. PC13 TaxID=1855299 RepID=UPI0008E3CC25|nr:methyltransferase [Oscillibacter sp. PC13]SFP22067.1 tRNA1Val (adenine37-N6)-methyltransferase [Oscillibacter sp. PC13]
MERSDCLFENGYRYFYDDRLFPPGTDTFLLSAFPCLTAGCRVCDLGSGTGLLGLLLVQRQPKLAVTGVEILPDAVRLAEKTAAFNGLADRLSIRQGDLRDARRLFPTGSFDLVVCNPPYYPVGTGRLAEGAALQTARSEISCTLEDLCTAAAWLLRWGGSFCLVHKPERLTDLLCAMRAHAMEPKRLRMVCKTAEAAPSLLLLEGRRGGKPGLRIDPPLILQNELGRPTAEMNAIYFRTQEDMP